MFRKALKALGIWNRDQRRVYKELSNLSAKDLRDIGICRNDVMRIVEEMK